MNPTQTITRAQLREKLSAIKGATFVTISALTDARARKTGNPFDAVLKLSRVNGVVGMSYENSVNRQLAREGKDQLTFKAKERSWGEHETAALIVKDGPEGQKAYLAIQPRNTRRLALFGQTAKGLRQVSEETVKPFLPAYRPPTNQGTDKPVEHRTYALESIAAITMGGESFRVRD